MRVDLIDLKERIAIGGTFTPEEKNFIVDCIDEATKPEPIGATAYLDPGNYLAQIQSIYAFLSVDAGGEGVCAAPMGNLGAVPLIAADEARLKSIRPLAVQIAKIFNKPVRLVQFTERRVLEEIEP